MADYTRNFDMGRVVNVIPRFYRNAQQNNFKSEQAGHPVFDDIEMVEILIPGDKNSIVSERVKDEHRNRWPKEYEAFKRGLEPVEDGAPLAEWPPLTPAQVANFASINIRTVEQLAGVNDNNLQALGMGGRQIREKARNWLEQAKGGEPLARVEAENEQLRQDLETVKAQLADVVSRLPKEREQAA